MATAAQPLTTAVKLYQGGSNAVALVNENYNVTFGGTWAPGETWTLELTDATSGLQTQIGDGMVTGLQGAVFCFTYQSKVYVLAGTDAYFSAVNAPTTFNDPNGNGNSYVDMSENMAMPENLTAMAPFQGYLVFISRRTAQLWAVASNPQNWSLQQIFENIGTLSGLSVQSLGDFDVLFLSDSGIRSFRLLQTTLHASVADLGAPVDSLVQAAILANPIGAAASCGIVEPTVIRYWLHLNGTIYVLSFFPGAKIVAWSTYLPTYQNGAVQTEFAPLKFDIYHGQVYALGNDNAIYQYGGNGGNVFDNCVATIQTPFHDVKSPTNRKNEICLHAACSTGNPQTTWTISAAVDLTAAPANPVWNVVKRNITGPTFDQGRNGVQMSGTHLALAAVSSGSGSATFSEFVTDLEVEEQV